MIPLCLFDTIQWMVPDGSYFILLEGEVLKELVKQKRLKSGDTIAAISISGGRAGDSDMLCRYELGKKRLEEIFGLHVVETPNALKGNDFLFRHPQSRAGDLMGALKSPDIKGIIANMGGDDSYRLLPYIDFDIIHSNPKIMMGYSDITTMCAYFTYAGIMSYYGPNILTPIAQPVRLDEYTKQAIKRVLFSNEIIGQIRPCSKYTPIEWENKPESEIIWHENTGYKVIQGTGKATGRLIGGCAGPLHQIMGTFAYPQRDVWEDSIIFLENGSPYGSALAGLHEWRVLAASGIFDKVKGMITNSLNEEEAKLLLRFLKHEVHREDLPILTNVDFGHRTPMTVLPIGAKAEIDCDKGTFSILESGVA